MDSYILSFDGLVTSHGTPRVAILDYMLKDQSNLRFLMIYVSNSPMFFFEFRPYFQYNQ
jgi:hypothetical protein